MQHLNQSAQGHEMLYADRYSMDEQVLFTAFVKKKGGGRLKVTTRVLFYGDDTVSHKLLYLR
jgi:hypothetical protein